MKKLLMKYRRLWSIYQCHRYRSKTHLQIVLELLAKLIANPFISTRLMQISLQCHGIQSESKLAKVLCHRRADVHAVMRSKIFSGQFLINVRDEGLWAVYRSQFGEKIRTVIDDADTICRHEFNLLGSGVTYWGHPIDWHVDPISGYRWPKRHYFGLKSANKSSKGNDVKLPWELSRMQHLPTLGKAYRLTKDGRYAREIVEQLSHWLIDNPCPYGVNWTCAMDVAIRIMNITWAYLLIEDNSAVTHDFRTRLATSIMQHGQFVLFNLEHSIQSDGSITNGNHYLTDIVGLLHLGLLCPKYPMADTWRRVGLTALVEEMDRQVHPDGSDFESSLPYHRLVLELFVAGALLCRSNGVTLPQRFWDKLEKMFEVVLFVTRPDGKVPQVGDADDGRLYILSDYGSWERTDYRYILSIGAVLFHRGDMKAHVVEFSEEAFWLLGPSSLATFAALKGEEEDIGSRQFRESGLYVMRAGSQYLLACCGAVGTGGVGNHKHNDIMSFELFAGDKAFIVDPGAYVYTRYPEWRNLFRSTQYHNTVVVDGQEQNRFEASNLFKMAADSAVIIHEWASTPEKDWLDAEHTGYTRLAHPVRHRRTFLFEKWKGTWTITDLLTSKGMRTVDWYVHLDHGIELMPIDEGVFRTQSKGTNLVLAVDGDLHLTYSIVDGWVSRRYGHKLPAKILHMQGTFTSGCRVVLTARVV